MRRISRYWPMIGAGLMSLQAHACSVDPAGTTGLHDVQSGDFAGVALSEQPLLAAGCTISGSAMTVTVKDGESALLALRTADSIVTVNGHVFSGAADTNTPCAIASTGTIQVNADLTGATH